MLVGGNTAQGVFEEKYPPPPDTYIDINGVSELKSHAFDGGNLYVGANMTLTETIKLFLAVSQEQPSSFGYLETLARHMIKVAHIPVRNIGTLAGNLSTKHAYPRFPSDLFTIYETVGAQLVIDSGDGSTRVVSFPEYLETNMYKRIIKHIVFQNLNLTYVVKTYKVMRRAQNDHAIVNAGFCFRVNKTDGVRVVGSPTLVYGGIRPDFIHARRTERYLEGRRLLNRDTLMRAFTLLNTEVNPDRRLPEASVEYRKGLALSLFYRFVLRLNPAAVNPRYRSGGDEIARPLTSGTQEYFSDPAQYPLTEPLPKLESLVQCSGEIEYTNDVAVSVTELFASLVLTDRGPATLELVDPTTALKIPGVVAFFSAKDIPGVNSFISIVPKLSKENEELFASEKTTHAGQSVGVVVAVSQDLADFAAQRVLVVYSGQKKPVLTIQDVLAKGDKDRLHYIDSIQPKTKKGDVVHKIEGSFSYKGQYHYHYETQTCAVVPRDNNSLDVVVSTQWMQGAQESISKVLDISENRINVQMRRCGGAFGGKIYRCLPSACACALAAYLLQRPVRIALTLETNMHALGGRYHMYTEYEVGVDGVGVIQYLQVDYYTDKGVSLNDSVTSSETKPGFHNIYDSSTWTVKFYDVITDKPTTTLVRAPGHLGGIGTIEHIMEHIAWTVKKDPVAVRLSNQAKEVFDIEPYIAEVKSKADFDNRLQLCRHFNSVNQWKKRGISLVPMKYEAHFQGVFHAMVSIYRADGTVAISMGASEVGQGVNTKIAQIAAHEFGIPLVYIQIKPNNNFTSPNDIFSAGSTSTDANGFAVRKCCEEINKRLDEVRASLPKDTPWPELIKKAYEQNINLNATYMFVPNKDLANYAMVGATILEVEIDCLTGEHRVVRVDILQNLGQSLNPFIDIGQIEGAFLMGLGHFTSEELIFDPTTGLLTTDRTWEYKVPGAKDIPEDWRIYSKKDPDSPPYGPYGSKSVAESPLVMSVSVLFAIRRAIESLRRDLGLPDTFFMNDPPCSSENLFLRCNSSYTNYSI